MTAVKCAFCVYFIAVWLAVNGQNAPLSPCPKIFKYENDGMQWYGTIKIPPPFGSEMKLVVSLSIGAKLPSKYAGNIELVGERGRILLNILRGLPITYKVNFPVLTPISKITKIVFNGKVFCEGPAETYKQGVTVVTAATLDHVLKTSEGANNTQDIPDDSMEIGSRPNPDNFANPRPTKTQSQNVIPQKPAIYIPDELEFSNDVNNPNIIGQLPSSSNENNYENNSGQDSNYYGTETTSRPTYVEPPQTKPRPAFIASQSRPNQNNYENRPNQDTNYYGIENSNTPQNGYDVVSQSRPQGAYGSSQPRPAKPEIPQRPQQPVNAFVTNNFDTYHDSLVGTSNVLPSPDILAQKPITPPKNVIKPGDPLYNYHLSQDRNVSKTEVYHGTPENANLPYNYFYHEVNKTVVNRFSYEYTHQNPGVVQVAQNGQPHYINTGLPARPQNRQPSWKGSPAELQQQRDDVQLPAY